MEFPNDPVPYDVLMTHVKELHLHSPIQLPSQTDLMGNCTTFAVSLTTDLSKKYFPNGSPLAGQVPHRIQFSPQAHMNIITPPDRVELSLGCVRHSFKSLEELVAHVDNPENGVVVATVTGAGHAFNVVRTDQGTKIADAQYGFVCDFKDWEDILKIASGNQTRFTGGNFGMMNVREHDPTFARHLANLDKDMAKFSQAPKVVEKINDDTRKYFEDQRDMAGVVFNSVTDPEIVDSLASFDDVGFRYTNDEKYPDQTTSLEINATDLDLKPGDWIAARDSMGNPVMLLGSKHGICEMRLDPYRATLTDREINEDLHIVASSSSLDLRNLTRTPYAITRPELGQLQNLADLNINASTGFER